MHVDGVFDATRLKSLRGCSHEIVYLNAFEIAESETRKLPNARLLLIDSEEVGDATTESHHLKCVLEVDLSGSWNEQSL